MKAEFWHARWARNEIGFHQRQINSHLKEFRDRLGLAPGRRVFVPLCGKSRDMLWLQAQGYGVLGIEISPIAVQAFFAENGLRPQRMRQGPFERYATDGLELLCGDFFALTAQDLIGIGGIYDRASLIALPPEQRAHYAAHLKELVPPEAPILLLTLEYPQHEMSGPPFSVSEEEVRALYEDCYRVTRLYSMDALAEHPRFRAKGLTRLAEHVYLLSPAR